MPLSTFFWLLDNQRKSVGIFVVLRVLSRQDIIHKWRSHVHSAEDTGAFLGAIDDAAYFKEWIKEHWYVKCEE